MHGNRKGALFCRTCAGATPALGISPGNGIERRKHSVPSVVGVVFVSGRRHNHIVRRGDVRVGVARHNMPVWRNGRRGGPRNRWPLGRMGSNPFTGIRHSQAQVCVCFVLPASRDAGYCSDYAWYGRRKTHLLVYQCVLSFTCCWNTFCSQVFSGLARGRAFDAVAQLDRAAAS